MRRKTVGISWKQVATAQSYKVFWGTKSRIYTYSQDVGSNLSYRVDNLRPSITYYFAAKAYNVAGGSPYSNELSKRL